MPEAQPIPAPSDLELAARPALVSLIARHEAHGDHPPWEDCPCAEAGTIAALERAIIGAVNARYGWTDTELGESELA